MTTISTADISDRELLERTGKSASDERHVTAELLALLAEVDSRRLYLGEGCASLFTYCTQVLHLSEHAAYHRIEGARAARRFPIILDLVADGSVTLTTVALLRPHLTPDNHEALLAEACHRRKREVEHQIACLAPRPGVPALIRRLPAENPAELATETRTTEPFLPAGSAPTPNESHLVSSPDEPAPTVKPPQPLIAPLASDRYLLRVTLSADAHAALRRAQQLMAHSVPDGNPAVIVEKALSLLVTELERSKTASARRPREQSNHSSASASGSRHIPAAIRRQVWGRDEGRCAFVGARGRCTETSRLEFHHLVPFARGGPTTVANVAIRCRAHNSYEGEQAFGARAGRAVELPL